MVKTIDGPLQRVKSNMNERKQSIKDFISNEKLLVMGAKDDIKALVKEGREPVNSRGFGVPFQGKKAGVKEIPLSVAIGTADNLTDLLRANWRVTTSWVRR